jgi:uncharacterized protein YggU (UPF0235/DUF167 family)
MPETGKSKMKKSASGAAITVSLVRGKSDYRIRRILDDGTLEINTPGEGKGDLANEELVGFLCGLLGVAPTQIDIIAGAERAEKIISIDGLSPDEVDRKVLAALK